MNSAAVILEKARTAGVDLQAAPGGKLRCRCRGLLPDDLRQAILACKEELLALLHAETTERRQHSLFALKARGSSTPATPRSPRWPGADALDLQAWFATFTWPTEPFVLGRGRTIINPAQFLGTLKADVERGPAGPHVHHGQVMANLRLLRQLFDGRQGDAVPVSGGAP